MTDKLLDIVGVYGIGRLSDPRRHVRRLRGQSLLGAASASLRRSPGAAVRGLLKCCSRVAYGTERAVAGLTHVHPSNALAIAYPEVPRCRC
jgi:hypothetical protein